MGSRIAHHTHFPDYTIDDLMGIACLILEEQRYSFSEEAEAAFRDYLERRMKRRQEQRRGRRQQQGR